MVTPYSYVAVSILYSFAVLYLYKVIEALLLPSDSPARSRAVICTAAWRPALLSRRLVFLGPRSKLINPPRQLPTCAS